MRAKCVARTVFLGKKVLSALRVHQYVKNLLIFVPLILGFRQLSLAVLGQSMIVFAGFCCLASALYVFNDLMDLNVDRQHASKKNRPFADGTFSVGFGLFLIFVLSAVSVFIGIYYLNTQLQILFVSYAILSLLYSCYFKSMLLIDVSILATLYTLRIYAGMVLIRGDLAHWLLLFSMFFFLSLAFIKRYVELQQRKNLVPNTPIPGRAYLSSHTDLLAVFGISSGYLSILVFSLYINSDRAIQQYNCPSLLYITSPLLIYWLSRLWLIASEGRMCHDPILFALKDKVSYVILSLISGIFLLSAIAI